MIELYLMTFLGLCSHYLKDIIRLRNEGQMMSLKQYWCKHPYQSLLTVVGAVVGFIALSSMEQLNPVTAFGIGYMANSVADTIGKRTVNKL